MVDVGWLSGSYNENIVTVKLGNKWGILNRTNGTTVSPIEYYTRYGLTKVQKDGKWGIVKNNGKIMVSPAYDSIQTYFQTYPHIYNGEKWGYLDEI